MMPTALKPYSEYRPSGLGWLGEVPTHWDIRRFKFILRERDSRSVSGQEQLLSVSQYTGVSKRSKMSGGNVPVTRAETLVGYKQVSKNDLVVNIMLAWNGSMGVSAFKGIVSPSYCVYRFSKDALPQFYHYLLRSPMYRGYIRAVSTGVVDSRLRLYTEDLYGLFGIIPSLSEQVAIVRYLDHVDSCVRRYISAKERMIELLAEQKQAIINQAVTRGLDPNIRLKPSGVEWLGDVPAHWERCRLRNVVSQVTTGSRGWSSYASDTGPLFIRVANLNRGSLQLRFDDVVRLNLPNTSEIARTRIRAGDLLVSVTAYIGSVGIAPEGFEEAYVSQHVARCQPRPGLSSQWLGYVLLSTVGQTHGQISLYGGTKDGLSLADVKNYQILLPPRAEQTAIFKYLDKATADIDATIGRARRQIELMQDYRTRLIADVVTGKLDVRGAVADEVEIPTP